MNSKDNDKGSMNIQDEFLNSARKDRTILAVFFTNGKKIIGKIKNFDRFTVLLELANKQEQLVFKHAVSSMTPAKYMKQRQHFTLD